MAEVNRLLPSTSTRRRGGLCRSMGVPPSPRAESAASLRPHRGVRGAPPRHGMRGLPGVAAQRAAPRSLFRGGHGCRAARPARPQQRRGSPEASSSHGSRPPSGSGHREKVGHYYHGMERACSPAGISARVFEEWATSRDQHGASGGDQRSRVSRRRPLTADVAPRTAHRPVRPRHRGGAVREAEPDERDEVDGLFLGG